MKKLIFLLLTFLFLIFALGIISLWLAPDISNPESLGTILSQLQEITPNNESPKEIPYKDFVSPDAHFKMEYPSAWMAISQEELLRALVPQEWSENYGLKALFMAQSFQQEGFVQLVVYRGTFKMSAEEIFEKMKETNKKNGWQVEVLQMETDLNGGIFEGKYKNQAGTMSHSKEKILISDEDGYLVSLFALEKDWQGLEETIDKILISAKI